MNAVEQAEPATTPKAPAKGKRRWTKRPPDGTNWSYWDSNDGCGIEVKPRFRPRMDYTLDVSSAATGGTPLYGLRFRTLASAQDAADWPLEKLVAKAAADAILRRQAFGG